MSRSKSRRPPSDENAPAPTGPEGSDARRPPVRLQKFLASAGIASRRDCEELITAGRVTIDGRVVRDLGHKVIPGSQKVTVDGETVRIKPRRYYLINKPKGYVCSHYDREGKPLAVSLVRDASRLFTVGRLDEASSGLLLVTNDGDLAERLAHPRYQVERLYRVQVAGVPSRDTLQLLERGIQFAEGRFRIRGVRSLKTQGKSTFLEVVLTEGQNREIRRLFARVGHKVLSLTRIGFGPLKLAGLPTGGCRPLTPSEISDLLALLEQGQTRVAKQRGSAVVSGRLRIRPAEGLPRETSSEGEAKPRQKRTRDHLAEGRRPSPEPKLKEPALPPTGEPPRSRHSGSDIRRRMIGGSEAQAELPKPAEKREPRSGTGVRGEAKKRTGPPRKSGGPRKTGEVRRQGGAQGKPKRGRNDQGKKRK